MSLSKVNVYRRNVTKVHCYQKTRQYKRLQIADNEYHGVQTRLR